MRLVRTFLVSIVVLLLLAVPAGAYVFQQDIRDWWKLRDYEPSLRIQRIAADTTMNILGKRLFYLHDPQILQREEFNGLCHSHGEQTIILGCYTGTEIFVYDVPDQQLRGVIEVTSAHEMLHAAYDRLNEREKTELHELLDQQLRLINSQRVLDLVDQYRHNDESTVYNEMHSIFGTEVRVLLPELEQYYARYFSDRPAVVALSESYEAVFTTLKNDLKAMDESLAEQKRRIDSLESSIADQQAALSARRSELESQLARGDTTGYNNGVSAYNRLVVAYNKDIASAKQLIASYNELVDERNRVSIVHNNLINTLDSTYSPL